MNDNPGTSINDDDDHGNDDENKDDRNDEPRYVLHIKIGWIIDDLSLFIIYHKEGW